MKKRTSRFMAIALSAALTLIAACSGQPVGDAAGAAPTAAASSPAPVVPPVIPREAIIGDDVPAVAAALRGGAEANAVYNDGSSATPMQLAAEKNAAGVNITEKYGYTALMFAAGKKSLPLVEFLVARGANVNARAKNGQSALDVAMKTELNDEVIAFLKDHDVPVRKPSPAIAPMLAPSTTSAGV